MENSFPKALSNSSKNMSNLEIRVSKPQFSLSGAPTAKTQNWSGEFVQTNPLVDFPKVDSIDSPQLSSNLNSDE